MLKSLCLFLTISLSSALISQTIYLGSDMSYVNEMEDCGVEYFEDEIQNDPYAIFADYGCNLVRLRLWHTPSWYDELNDGNRYSDLDDVKIAIARAKQNNMEVLLDFHLSDNWADPSKQLVPAAWLPVVDDLELLKDSLYQYIFATLSELHEADLLPEMIQIGNETNKGILLSPADNAEWTLDWERNAALFNKAIKAVEDFEQESSTDIKIVLHVAGPANAEWLIDGFITNGVTGFDIIGLSYYWAWHQPTTTQETGQIIETLRILYPNKEVLVVETGYIWTTDWNDNASNIITETHADYHPASPENQRDWLINLTQEVIHSGGIGVIYWEPCWVSSSCFTQWGQGSHQEHATFFDFDNQLLLPGGIEWMSYEYEPTSTRPEPNQDELWVQILSNSFSGDIVIKQLGNQQEDIQYIVTDTIGNTFVSNSFRGTKIEFNIRDLPFGIYIVAVYHRGKFLKSKKVVYGKG